jgi:hypothetical protein
MEEGPLGRAAHVGEWPQGTLGRALALPAASRNAIALCLIEEGQLTKLELQHSGGRPPSLCDTVVNFFD